MDVEKEELCNVNCNEDEDVTLKGSPLHEYLDNLSVDDNHVDYTNFPAVVLSKKELHGFWYGTSVQEFLLHQWKAFRVMVENVFPVSNDVLVKMTCLSCNIARRFVNTQNVCQMASLTWQYNLVSQHYYSRYGQEILESKVMLEEDLDYLCLQTPQLFLKCLKKKKNENVPGTADTDHLHSRHFLLLSCYIACFVAVLFLPGLPSTVSVCLTLMTVFVTCFNLRLQIIIEMWKRKHNSNLYILRRFVKSSEKFDVIVRRCIRLIQDVEVVSRGYTLVNGKTPITRLEKHNLQSRRVFPKLRLMLLQCLVKSTISCRDVTHKLMEYKLHDDYNKDLDAYYICNVPLKELGICFSESTSSVELYTATDGYSLAVLKTLVEILQKQRSELLTRLSLTLSGTTWNFLDEGFLSTFPSILADPYKTAMDSIVSLLSAYEMHEQVNMIKDESKNAKKPSDTDERRKKTSVLRINLHSLQVHMRAAMCKCIEAEGLLSHVDEKNKEGHVSSSLESIKAHLDNSSECWQQCLKEVEFLRVKSKSGDSPSGDAVSPPTEKIEDQPEDKSNATETFGMEEETFEDQIFEAMTEGLDDDVSSRGRFEDNPSDKQVREQSTSVIRELQSVLSVKTSTKQREMWKKQLFPSYKSKQPKEEEDCSTVISTSKQAFSASEENNLTKSESEPLKSQENLSTSEEEAASETLPLNQSPQHLARRKDTSNTTAGCGQEERLCFPKKAFPPGRPPSLRSRRHKRGDAYVMDTTEEIDQDSRSSPQPNDRGDESVTAPEDGKMDWAVGLGLGFSNSLALQAVAKARMRARPVVEAVTYGSSSSDEETTT